MHRKLRHLLQAAELREDEIDLYLLLLKLRKASMSELIEKSKLNTMTAYRTIKRLEERDLVKATAINQKQCIYEPLSLASLTKRLDTEQRKMRRLQLALEGMDAYLPYIDTEHDNDEYNDNEPIAILEGRDAFREEYLRMPDVCEQEYLHIGSMHNYWDVARMDYDCPEELGFRAKRFRKGVSCRILNEHNELAEEFVKRDSLEMRTTRLLEKLPVMDNYLAIAETQVCHFICDDDNPRVIRIRQPELVELHKNQFKQLWRSTS